MGDEEKKKGKEGNVLGAELFKTRVKRPGSAGPHGEDDLPRKVLKERKQGPLRKQGYEGVKSTMCRGLICLCRGGGKHELPIGSREKRKVYEPL